MKISLKLANGSTLDFEGDESEFERVSKFLEDPPGSLTADAGTPPRPTLDPPPSDGDAPELAPLDPATVHARLEEVGVNNDQERVTVIAQLAVESGREGIDYETLDQLWTDLAFWKPAQFPSKTFANAKSSGLVKPVKPGLWKPTFKGQNFARGFGRGERQARRSATRPRSRDAGKGGDSD